MSTSSILIISNLVTKSIRNVIEKNVVINYHPQAVDMEMERWDKEGERR